MNRLAASYLDHIAIETKEKHVSGDVRRNRLGRILAELFIDDIAFIIVSGSCGGVVVMAAISEEQ